MVSIRSVLATAIAAIGVSLVASLAVIAFEKGDVEFNQGTDLYAKKKYREALLKFMEASNANPKNSLALLFLGNCCLYIGEKEHGIKYYQTLYSRFPTSPAGLQAKQWLEKAGLLTQFQRTSPRKAAAPGPVAASIDGIVSVVRPRADRPAVSAEKVKAIQKALEGIPEAVKGCLLINKVKVRIYITPTVEDYEPGCKYQEASGYEGGTYKSCPAFYINGKVVIAEHTLDEDDESVSDPIAEGDMKNALYHELGHALDDCLNDLSESKEFRHVYWQDQARIDSETAHRLRYFLQQSTVGQGECCAELIGGLLGMHRDHTPLMREAFPLTLQFLRSKLQM